MDQDYRTQVIAEGQWKQEHCDALLDDLRAKLQMYDTETDSTSLQFLEKVLAAGEYSIFIDTIAATVSTAQIPMTATESTMLRELLYRSENPSPQYSYIVRRDEVMDSLNIVGTAP